MIYRQRISLRWLPHPSAITVAGKQVVVDKTGKDTVVTPHKEKDDVYMQVMNNWDIFVDYVWNEGKKQRR